MCMSCEYQKLYVKGTSQQHENESSCEGIKGEEMKTYEPKDREELLKHHEYRHLTRQPECQPDTLR